MPDSSQRTTLRVAPTFTCFLRAAVFRTAGLHQNHPIALVVVNDVVLQRDGRHHIQIISKVLHKYTSCCLVKEQRVCNCGTDCNKKVLQPLTTFDKLEKRILSKSHRHFFSFEWYFDGSSGWVVMCRLRLSPWSGLRPCSGEFRYQPDGKHSRGKSPRRPPEDTWWLFHVNDTNTTGVFDAFLRYTLKGKWKHIAHVHIDITAFLCLGH